MTGILTPDMAAERMHTSARRIRGLIRSGKLPGFTLDGTPVTEPWAHLLTTEGDVAEFVKARKEEAASVGKVTRRRRRVKVTTDYFA